MKNKTICVVSLIGGMIVGSALTMLLTPQSGPELRGRIKDFIDEGVDKVKSKAERVKNKIKSEFEEVGEHYSEEA